MKRKILSFLVVALIIVTAGMAAQVNAASQGIQKHNLQLVQAQANTSKPISIELPTDAKILMNKSKEELSGQVVKIDDKSQELSIQRGKEKISRPFSQINKVVFSDDPKDRKSSQNMPLKGDVTSMKGRPETWPDIPMNAFRLVNPNNGQAEVNLGSVVPPDQLKSIHSVLKGDGETKRKFVVNEMQFNVPKKTMTITATPY